MNTTFAESAAKSNRSRWSLWLTLAAALLVVLVAVWQIAPDRDVTRFHPDESRWINRSEHLAQILNPLSSYWADAYLIRGQPPMGSYITGLGLFLQGIDLGSNGPWNFSFGNESDINWNVTHGNVPDADHLLAARNTSIVIGILTCLTVFVIVTMLTNWIGGTAAGLYMAMHPLNVYLSTLAVSDAAFTLVIALSVLATTWLGRKPGWGRIALLGVILGIGASLKLSPMFVAFGLALVGVLLLAGPLASRVRPLRAFWTWIGAYGENVRRLGWMLLVLPIITLTFFVLAYPYLWSNPVGRTQVLFEFRRDEMRAQSRIWGDAAIDSRTEAVDRIWTMLEERYSTSGKVLVKLGIAEPRANNPNGAEPGYDLPFAIAGLLIFVCTAFWRGFRSPQLLALLTLAGQTVIIFLGLNIDFNRYYLPFVLVFAIGIGVGIGEVVRGAQVLWTRRRLRVAAPLIASSHNETAPSPGV